MTIKVHLLSASKPIKLDNVTNTYTKDGLFCVLIREEKRVLKYPMCNIYNIEEPYESESLINVLTEIDKNNQAEFNSLYNKNH